MQARERDRELGERVRLDVIGPAAALAHGAGGIARARGGRLGADLEGQARGRDGDPLEVGGRELVAIVARGQLDAGAEVAGERAAGERLPREDGELGRGEERLGGSIDEVRQIVRSGSCASASASRRVERSEASIRSWT